MQMTLKINAEVPPSTPLIEFKLQPCPSFSACLPRSTQNKILHTLLMAIYIFSYGNALKRKPKKQRRKQHTKRNWRYFGGSSKGSWFNERGSDDSTVTIWYKPLMKGLRGLREDWQEKKKRDCLLHIHEPKYYSTWIFLRTVLDHWLPWDGADKNNQKFLNN